MFCFSCGENSSSNSKIKNRLKYSYKVKISRYHVNSIPTFFEAIVANHLNEIKITDSSQFREFCNANSIEVNNSLNANFYYTVSTLHKFFTCQNATNGSRGSIINIPYYWHWVNPNPRYEIFLKKSNKRLNEITPPKEFSKYKSFADIDRTPYLFMSELFIDTPKYYSTLSDTFSTFGWCSEREMAFVSLMDILGYKGKVIAESNHSWSEFIIPMIDNKNESQEFKVKIDNTFDLVNWDKISSADIIKWNNYQGKSKQAEWYNIQAHSEKEKGRIQMFPLSKAAINRIEKCFVDYLNRTINGL